MICVDASVAAEWVLAEEYSQHALALAVECRRTGQFMIAPAVLPFEVTNVIRRHMLRDGLPAPTPDVPSKASSAFP